MNEFAKIAWWTSLRGRTNARHEVCRGCLRGQGTVKRSTTRQRSWKLLRGTFRGSTWESHELPIKIRLPSRPCQGYSSMSLDAGPDIPTCTLKNSEESEVQTHRTWSSQPEMRRVDCRRHGVVNEGICHFWKLVPVLAWVVMYYLNSVW